MVLLFLNHSMLPCSNGCSATSPPCSGALGQPSRCCTPTRCSSNDPKPPVTAISHDVPATSVGAAVGAGASVGAGVFVGARVGCGVCVGGGVFVGALVGCGV